MKYINSEMESDLIVNQTIVMKLNTIVYRLILWKYILKLLEMNMVQTSPLFYGLSGYKTKVSNHIKIKLIVSFILYYRKCDT